MGSVFRRRLVSSPLKKPRLSRFPDWPLGAKFKISFGFLTALERFSIGNSASVIVS